MISGGSAPAAVYASDMQYILTGVHDKQNQTRLDIRARNDCGNLTMTRPDTDCDAKLLPVLGEFTIYVSNLSY